MSSASARSNVVYRTSKPQYVVEHFYGNEWLADGGAWVAERGFVGLENAKECADEQQALFPEAQFRVVDTQP